MGGNWSWDFTLQILPRLIEATGYTLLAALIGYLIAMVLGLVLALAQRTPWRVLTLIAREFVEFIRSTPLILQIFFVFYVAPQFGVRLSPWTAGMIAIGLHYAAYLSEVYRGGLESVEKGQWEAATSLNLGTAHCYRRIILPQAVTMSLPALVNELILLVKASSLVSVVGIMEITRASQAQAATTFRPMEVYLAAAAIYLAINLCLAAVGRYLEHRMAV